MSGLITWRDARRRFQNFRPFDVENELVANRQTPPSFRQLPQHGHAGGERAKVQVDGQPFAVATNPPVGHCLKGGGGKILETSVVGAPENRKRSQQEIEDVVIFTCEMRQPGE